MRLLRLLERRSRGDIVVRFIVPISAGRHVVCSHSCVENWVVCMVCLQLLTQFVSVYEIEQTLIVASKDAKCYLALSSFRGGSVPGVMRAGNWG